MKLTLRQQLTQFAHLLQTELFPVLNEELGELTEPAKRLVAPLETIPLARFVPSSRGWVGRPAKDRLATMSSQRVTHCYELMDAAYDAGHILEHIRQLGHVPIVDPVQRTDPKKSFVPPDAFVNLIWPLLILSFGPTRPWSRLLSQAPHLLPNFVVVSYCRIYSQTDLSEVLPFHLFASPGRSFALRGRRPSV